MADRARDHARLRPRRPGVRGDPSLPGSLTIALLVALAIGVEKWRLLGQQAGWVSFAAVLMLTVGAEDPSSYVLRYAGLTLIGAVVGSSSRPSCSPRCS